jgi:ATP-binding cassette subfamily F protein 3
LNLYRGEKAALVGANGEGKTTLTKLITTQLAPQKGHVLLGERAVLGYYAQHQIDNLNPKNTVRTEVEEVAAEIYRMQIRDILGVFKLSGEDINKKIAVLSGGEKARVSLAKMLLSPANFLIMDEPTNHLDIHSKEALEKALQKYDGTLLLISHDRYFLDKLVTIVFELRDGRLRRFEGNYSDYLKKRIGEEQVPEENTKDSNGDNPPERKDKEKKRLEAQARQQISKKRRTLSEKIEKIEKEIESLEEEKKNIEQLMADPEFYKNEMEVAKKGKKYQDLQIALPQLYAQWETIHAELENLLKTIQN